jgi:glycosyltransferase involved in cell wall biosynthesis
MDSRGLNCGPQILPLVSIGMPVYNGERYIGRAIESLLAQDYPALEIVVLDDASTDRTAEICRRYAETDPRVRVHTNERNLGMNRNFSAVAGLARGEYFMWAAQDDEWLPQFVSTLVTELEAHSEAVVAMGAIERRCADGSPHDVIRFAGPRAVNSLSSFQLAMRVAAWDYKYHLFLYGLFRTSFHQRASRDCINMAAAEQLFILQAAMAGRFRSVDTILFKKWLIQNKKGEPWEVARECGPYLLRSPVLPWHRKLWVPLVQMRLTAAVAGMSLRVAASAWCGRLLGERRRDALKQHLRRTSTRPDAGAAAAAPTGSPRVSAAPPGK